MGTVYCLPLWSFPLLELSKCNGLSAILNPMYFSQVRPTADGLTIERFGTDVISVDGIPGTPRARFGYFSHNPSRGWTFGGLGLQAGAHAGTWAKFTFSYLTAGHRVNSNTEQTCRRSEIKNKKDQ